MKKFIHILSLLLLASPLTTFAHGEEVLVTVFLELIVFVILFVGLLTINFTGPGKLIIGAIGVLAIALTLIAINSLPYNQYRTVINIVVVTIPLTIMIISYFGLKGKFKK